MSDKKITDAAKAVAIVLTSDPEAVRNGVNRLSLQSIHNLAEHFVEEVRNYALVEKSYRNTSPTMPGDDQESTRTKYPDRTEVKPTPLAVPDPAETEGATPKKISIPDYPEMKRFSIAMGELADSASKLFEIASENQQDKDEARRAALGWAEETRSSLYEL
jgi:hypothetical protein